MLIATNKFRTGSKSDGQVAMGPYQKIIGLVTVTPDDGVAALAMVAAMLIGMRLLYGAWPWESRKTWYRIKQFVPVPIAPAPNSEATETPVDTKDDHFDRKLMAAEPTSEATETLVDIENHFDRKLMAAEPNRKRTKRRSSKPKATETLVDIENHFDRKPAPPEPTSEATETLVDIENHFDRKLMAAE